MMHNTQFWITRTSDFYVTDRRINHRRNLSFKFGGGAK